ncbi:hypothetical protein FNV43_RR15620 [Rhamnella rubrinervis]|uniref:DUF4378 domain-containing protein n=1 Tax=Rhamnella rubrinervis TaxID=2594499 RepID=A0A8K0E9E4_9ROSA|nr:hypothetical protein FNV43_RR15620 [Rhamnella rubrinervis]
MAQKRLHQLLKEDQEPFLLKNYIADRRCQYKTPSPKTHLQVKKRKPISEASHFPANFCKNACFLSYHDSPDLTKSPLFEFTSPAKSPCKGSNAIFLHIPARTAALLLEAALRIQKQSTSSKPKNQKSNGGFGLFGSLLKRLAHRNRTTRKREIEGDGVKASVKDVLRWDSSVGRRKVSNEISNERMQGKMVLGVKDQIVSEISAQEISNSCACTGRPSSAVWSESNEDKSFDLETSSCSLSEHDSEEIEFVSRLREGVDDDKGRLCQSPFRFALQRSPSASGRRTLEFSSPVSSPSRHKREDKENCDAESLKKLQVEEEEEDKEQCSPVSVLDPPFEDDNVGHDDGEDGFDMECSYAIVQRTKQQLLHKLRRFEKLAELDPIELEKRMLEEADEDDNYDIDGHNEGGLEYEGDESETSYGEANVDGFVRQVHSKPSYGCMKGVPVDMKRLVSDLIAEEQRQHKTIDNQQGVVERVCKRFESWKEVESNTIDMMIEQDFRRELEEWKKNQEQLGESAIDIELDIFGLLVEELATELVYFSGI